MIHILPNALANDYEIQMSIVHKFVSMAIETNIPYMMDHSNIKNTMDIQIHNGYMTILM